jgi:hypothetical protein
MTDNPPQKLLKEQQFFEDAALDRMMGSLMALATEVYVLRTRLSALEAQVVKAGLADAEALNGAIGDQAIKEVKTDARQFAEALLKPLLGLQDAAGLPEE